MIHEKVVSMAETSVCSSARKYFLLHSRDFIQNNAGTEFVSVQGNALWEIILKKIFLNSSEDFTLIIKEEID
jgi:hypothetical protein